LQGDENYPIETIYLALADAITLVTKGRIVDARVIAALILAQRFLHASTSL
jgi:hypothetical protein